METSRSGDVLAKTFDAPPLKGVTVLDLTQIYNGPYATFLMAQAGAEAAAGAKAL